MNAVVTHSRIPRIEEGFYPCLKSSLRSIDDMIPPGLPYIKSPATQNIRQPTSMNVMR